MTVSRKVKTWCVSQLTHGPHTEEAWLEGWQSNHPVERVPGVNPALLHRPWAPAWGCSHPELGLLFSNLHKGSIPPSCSPGARIQKLGGICRGRRHTKDRCPSESLVSVYKAGLTENKGRLAAWTLAGPCMPRENGVLVEPDSLPWRWRSSGHTVSVLQAGAWCQDLFRLLAGASTGEPGQNMTVTTFLPGQKQPGRAKSFGHTPSQQQPPCIPSPLA